MWWLEGISKILLFISFWLLTPVVLGKERLKRFTKEGLVTFASLLSFLISLYGVSFIAMSINNSLEPELRFMYEPPPSISTEDFRKSQAQLLPQAPSPLNKQAQLTISPILAKDMEWMERREKQKYPRMIAGIAIFTLVGFGIRFSRTLLEKYVVNPLLNWVDADDRNNVIQDQDSMRRYAILGACFFTIGSIFDFVKWFMG